MVNWLQFSDPDIAEPYFSILCSLESNMAFMKCTEVRHVIKLAGSNKIFPVLIPHMCINYLVAILIHLQMPFIRFYFIFVPCIGLAYILGIHRKQIVKRAHPVHFRKMVRAT